MTTPSELTAKFVEAFEAFDVKTEQSTDAYINSIFELLGQLLYVVEYDKAETTHNLIGIIQDDATYSAKYGSSFVRPKRLKIFDATIDTTSAVTIKTRKAEAEHAAKPRDKALYNMAERESGLFILKVVDRVWLSSLSHGLPTYFSDVLAKTMLNKFQEICVGNHEIEILDLMD